MESSSSSGQSKRSRAPIMGVQTVACLVDGCTADLSGCKDYHRRHKVCELHSKSPKVTIGGHEQRFCQQCSRFHSLEEFDEVKRSCRKRLDGHNRRRRKPQLESSSMNSGSFLSNHEGTKYLNFGDPQVFPTSDQVLYGGHSQLNFFASQSSSIGSFSHSYKGGTKKQPQQQFPFLHGTSPDFPEASSVAIRTFLDPECCDGVNRERGSEDGRALSLLSSSSSSPAAQPFMPGLHYQQQRSMLVSDDNNLNSQETFQIGPNGPSLGGPHHRPFSPWD